MTPRSIRHPGEFRWETRLLAIATLLLTAFGIAECYSSSTYLNHAYAQATQQISGAVIGGVLFLVASYTDYRIWQRFAKVALYGTVVLLAAIALASLFFDPHRNAPSMVERFFPHANGARRWLQLGVQIQVSEVARFTLAAWVATRAAELGIRIRRFQDGFLPLVGVIGLVAFLVYLEPSVTMAGVVAVIGLAVMFTAGARIAHFALPLVVGLAGLVEKVLHSALRGQRVTDFANTSFDCVGQACTSVIGFANGGLVGLGFGSGSQKFGLLPEQNSDFLFSVVGEEWGLLGVCFVVLCFALVCWMGFRIARTARDPFGTYLASGIALSLGLSAFMHAAVVTQLMPVTGIPLPFMSAGRASLIINLFAVGVLVSIGRARGRPASKR